MYQIIKTQAYPDKETDKFIIPSGFHTYEAAERAVMELVDYSIKNYAGEGYLPTYEIEEI